MNFLNELFMFLAMKGSDLGAGLHDLGAAIGAGIAVFTGVGSGIGHLRSNRSYLINIRILIKRRKING